jgi:hypothetical protein
MGYFFGYAEKGVDDKIIETKTAFFVRSGREQLDSIDLRALES